VSLFSSVKDARVCYQSRAFFFSNQYAVTLVWITSDRSEMLLDTDLSSVYGDRFGIEVGEPVGPPTQRGRLITIPASYGRGVAGHVRSARPRFPAFGNDRSDRRITRPTRLVSGSSLSRLTSCQLALWSSGLSRDKRAEKSLWFMRCVLGTRESID
jgi:hypothetical protein